MFLLVASFLAGVLTSLAPCILPLLPVIVGSSILSDGDKKRDRLKPFIIAASLAISVIAFTLLLKVSSILIGLNPSVLTSLSGIIVIVIGIAMFFPGLWVRISGKSGFEHSSNKFLSKAFKQSGVGGAILTGAALGPVFSSCSPVYALVLATVLPVNLALGIVYIISFALGLGLALLAIALAGRRLTSKIQWAVNPNGAFRKILAVVLIAVGLLVTTGRIQAFQVWTAEHLPFGVSALEEKLIPKSTSGVQAPSRKELIVKKQFNVTAYDAPELQGIADWINTSPLTLKQLRGKVVVIDFWTYSCINCQRTQPYLNSWYDKYHRDGLEIIGVHAPEFAFEKVPANVRKAVKDDNIKYPVALDNDFATWGAYKNQYWPAKYLIDKDGQIRYTHFGEGKYDETEKVIQTLLKESGHSVDQAVTTVDPASPNHEGQTPETYLSYERGERFANANQFKADTTVHYTAAAQPGEHVWTIGGNWNVGAKQSVSTGDGSNLKIQFSAKDVYLVMSGPTDKPVTLTLNGEPVTPSAAGGEDVDDNGQVHLDGARLYKLIALPTFAQNQILDIHVPKGTTINAFTFGG
jgi:cytochrome c biogenesis protein CcdA/thiol-disulfide isomerase/thioredoxin